MIPLGEGRLESALQCYMGHPSFPSPLPEEALAGHSIQAHLGSKKPPGPEPHSMGENRLLPHPPHLPLQSKITLVSGWNEHSREDIRLA